MSTERLAGWRFVIVWALALFFAWAIFVPVGYGLAVIAYRVLL